MPATRDKPKRKYTRRVTTSPTVPTPPPTILDEAKAIIYGDRERTYGHPAKNLVNIANLWSAYLNGLFPELSPGDWSNIITPEDVCQMMILMKSARLMNTPDHRDSLVDQCGYAALQTRIDETPTND